MDNTKTETSPIPTQKEFMKTTKYFKNAFAMSDFLLELRGDESIKINFVSWPKNYVIYSKIQTMPSISVIATILEKIALGN